MMTLSDLNSCEPADFINACAAFTSIRRGYRNGRQRHAVRQRHRPQAGLAAVWPATPRENNWA
jgi:hypothetical protein